MNNSSTPLTDRQKRRKAADYSAAWRARRSGRPETKVIDRALLEALSIVLRRAELAPETVCRAMAAEMASLAKLGLERMGYDERQIEDAMLRRIEDHRSGRKGSAVRPALRDRRSRVGLDTPEPMQRRRRPAPTASDVAS